jgi:quinohemoprotein ethanol dehydrogenase
MSRVVSFCSALWLGLQLGVAAAAPHAAVDDARLSRAASEPENWLAHGGAHPDWYFSGLNKIDVSNIKRLRPAWFVELDTSRGQEATPLIADGTLYTTTAWSKVLAVDGGTGRVKWSFDPKVPGHAGYKSCCDVVNRGPALYLDRLYISTIDGRLISLNVATGKLMWSVLTVDPARMAAVTGAPRVMQGKVIIGNAGGETGARGYVSAYDAATGKMLWRFYTVPSKAASDGAASDAAIARIARPTWDGDAYESGGGGQVWNAIVADPRFGQIYIGTGNPFPWNPRFRSASAAHNDYLFTDSIVALDARTGKYRWHYQEVPNDAWDYDATEDMILLDARIDGKQHQVLMQAAKDGFFYILDRKTGKLLSATAFVDGMTWASGIDAASGRPLINSDSSYVDGPIKVNPGPNGGHSWRPSSYDPLTGFVYIPTAESVIQLTGVENYKFDEGVDDLGVEAAPIPAGKLAGSSHRPAEYLQAWNPLTQRREWQVPTVGGGGVLSTAGNLVFQGQHRNNTAGELVAYRADTGQQLWEFATPNAVLTGAVTYSVAGEQYVAVMTGAGGSADLLVPGSNSELMPSPGRLIAFKLGGDATLPADPEAAPPAWPVTDTASEEAVREGGAMFARLCIRCHGRAARSRNVVPDLRRVPVVADAAAWKAIVIDGTLEDAGMVSWKRFISAEDAEKIRAYVAAQARELANESAGGNANLPQ